MPPIRSKSSALTAVLTATLCLASTAQAAQTDADSNGFEEVPASRYTIEANRKVAAAMLDDDSDFQATERGFIARDDDLVIPGIDGGSAWNMAQYGFIKGDAPDTVNPSLWRQAKLNNSYGLYQVTDRIYQVREYALSTMSLIKGDKGWIVVDPLTTSEQASAAIKLARKHLIHDEPITAIIFTHSHIDHFGGVQGILDSANVAKDLKVIAPKGFMKESTSENLLAGPAMQRRQTLVFGLALPRTPYGHVDTGLGKALGNGNYSILTPTDTIDHTPQDMTVDGLKFVFQYTPESEAPSELTFYIPSEKAFCGAEVLSHTMHNLYTLRGAKVRDALKWSHYIDQDLQMYGNDVEVLFNSHHWPTWGNKQIVELMETERDTYRYIHDQTLRLANAGETPTEIVDQLKLPESLNKHYYNRGYYGSLRHNARAVYQYYFGWYDGNPANLNPLPPAQAGSKYVEFMGGKEAVVKKAQGTYNQGEYRWTAEVLNHVVMAYPDYTPARVLLSKTYKQLGYQSESGQWRDSYLSAAYELQHGAQPATLNLKQAKGLMEHVSVDALFDAMATRLIGPEAGSNAMTVEFKVTDADKDYIVDVSNGVLHHWPRSEKTALEPSATIRLSHDQLIRFVNHQIDLKDLTIDGTQQQVATLYSLIQQPDRAFNIVTP